MSVIPLGPVVFQGAVGNTNLGPVLGVVATVIIPSAERVQGRELRVNLEQVSIHIVGRSEGALLVQDLRWQTDLPVETNGQWLSFDLLIIHGIEKRLVSDHWTPQTKAKLLPIWRSVVTQEISHGKFFMPQVIECSAVIVPRPRLGHDVDESSRRSSKLGGEIPVHDSEFLNRLLAHQVCKR